jgi:hypothetical protein
MSYTVYNSQIKKKEIKREREREREKEEEKVMKEKKLFL